MRGRPPLANLDELIADLQIRQQLEILERWMRLHTGLPNIQVSPDPDLSTPGAAGSIRRGTWQVLINTDLIRKSARLDEDLALVLKGVVLHEMAHVLYTPPFSKMLVAFWRKRFSGRCRVGWVARLEGLWGILEDGRIETRLARANSLWAAPLRRAFQLLCLSPWSESPGPPRLERERYLLASSRLYLGIVFPKDEKERLFGRSWRRIDALVAEYVDLEFKNAASLARGLEIVVHVARLARLPRPRSSRHFCVPRRQAGDTVSGAQARRILKRLASAREDPDNGRSAGGSGGQDGHPQPTAESLVADSLRISRILEDLGSGLGDSRIRRQSIGRLDLGRLVPALASGDRRVFVRSQPDLQASSRLRVHLAIDSSESMEGAPLRLALQAGAAMDMGLRRVGHRSKISAFASTVSTLRDWDDPALRISAMPSGGTRPLGLFKAVASDPETACGGPGLSDYLLIILTDGEFEDLPDCLDVLRRLRRLGVYTYVLTTSEGIPDLLPASAVSRTDHMGSMEDFHSRLQRLVLEFHSQRLAALQRRSV